MLSKIHIQNFKSIVDEQLELGTFNVFIGSNGSGKSNVLEAVGMAAAAAMGRMRTEDLFNMGIRLARPNLMASAFSSVEIGPFIQLESSFSTPKRSGTITHRLVPRERSSHGTAWMQASEQQISPALKEMTFEELLTRLGNVTDEQMNKALEAMKPEMTLRGMFQGFGIYSPSTNALRGLEVTSRREPLGLYGENLDVTLARLPEPDLERIQELTRFIDWVDTFHVDPSDALKFEGLKLG